LEKHPTKFICKTSMPKLTQWAEDNIPEGLSIFGLGLFAIQGATHFKNKIKAFNAYTLSKIGQSLMMPLSNITLKTMADPQNPSG
jgi:hypothetical protein